MNVRCPSNLVRDDFQDDAGLVPDFEVRAHLETCPDCARYFAARERALSKLEESALPLPAPRSGGRRGRATAVVVGTAAAAMMGAWWLMPRSESTGLRTKGGGARVEILADFGTGTRRWAGEEVHPGVRLQFRMPGHVGAWGLVVGYEADGRRFAYAPRGGVAERVPESGELGSPVVLDASTGRERVKAIVCPEPFGMADVERPPIACKSTDIEFLKTPRP